MSKCITGNSVSRVFVPMPMQFLVRRFLKSPIALTTYSAFPGGICCGVTHSLVCPVDVVKTRMQLDPVKYSQGMGAGFRSQQSQGTPEKS
jgi:hypothetical protein